MVLLFFWVGPIISVQFSKYVKLPYTDPKEGSKKPKFK